MRPGQFANRNAPRMVCWTFKFQSERRYDETVTVVTGEEAVSVHLRDFIPNRFVSCWLKDIVIDREQGCELKSKNRNEN